MNAELELQFLDQDHANISFGGVSSGHIAFKNPLTQKDRQDIQWYLEVYGSHSLGDPDDDEARRISGLLPSWGKALFEAVFGDRAAARLFNRFQEKRDCTRLLTISAEHPLILSLPWELLHDSAGNGTFLFLENPRITIRRRMPGATSGDALFTVAPKDSLHLLFVVSRPEGAAFIDPRADGLAVLAALEKHAVGRVTWEFLRPPTLEILVKRLEDVSLPRVDILHFDGHGAFDRTGVLARGDEEVATRYQLPADEMTRDRESAPSNPAGANTGYLLFEDAEGKTAYVSAHELGESLNHHEVPLVILSACQSAAHAEQDPNEPANPDLPMGSVAVRLTAAGIPAVVAMTYSVLIHTTRALFGEFYENLAEGRGVGEALDNARRHLKLQPKRYDVQRGSQRLPLKLYDWFLPALYQQGADTPLLLPPRSSRRKEAQASHPDETHPPATSSSAIQSNLPPAPEAGFFGRKRKLWEIERWFAGPTRRITITGFGGQGKTALALEAGRWLTRTGLFHTAVFVDYSRIQARDAVAVAVSNLGTVLGESLTDATTATTALKQTPTLVILDNLEALAPDSLRALLDAAVPWSEAGGSRVLCTTRRPTFDHAAYRIEGTNIHRRLQLDGLGNKQAPDDALEWYAALMKLAPAPTVPAPRREALINLFDQVKFHPLSIRVLAQQLKTRRPAELGTRLEELLPRLAAPGTSAGKDEDTPAGLLASLELSLDQLDAAARQVLPRLGVLQGGAMEDGLVAITGLGDDAGARERIQTMLAAMESGDPRQILRVAGLDWPDGLEVPPQALARIVPADLAEQAAEFRQMLAKIPAPSSEANLWPGLRRQLEAAALLEPEAIPGVTVPFLRFHPTLAPMLWAQLDPNERTRLSTAHRKRYYALSGYLYQEDTRNPHQARAIAWRELPNLLHAVDGALDAADPHAGNFANNVNKFLRNFSLTQEAASLAAKAQAASGEAGSQTWFLAESNRGEQLFATGQVAEAAEVFQAILRQLGDAPTYERAVTLGRLGRCFRAGGRPDLATQTAEQAIAVCEKLEQTDGVKRHRGALLTDMADALAEQGKYVEARNAYLAGLDVDEHLKDLRGQGVTLGQLGTLAMREGDLNEAADRYRAALALFQQLREPTMEAVAWHQLGRVFQNARQWDEAERHYREAARIREEIGIISGHNGAAAAWNQLAIVSQNAGKPDAAERWYQKAIEGSRAGEEEINLSKALSNLADLLLPQPGRLAEARQLAEEGLAIAKTLDPGAAEIWKTYDILAEIADQEAQAAPEEGRKAERQTQARDYRRLARDAKRDFAGTRHGLRRHAPLIQATVAACAGEPKGRMLLAQHQAAMRRGGPDWTALAAALDRLLAGERDETVLCEGLGLDQAMIVETILAGLADPSTLSDLLPSEPPPTDQQG